MVNFKIFYWAVGYRIMLGLRLRISPEEDNWADRRACFAYKFCEAMIVIHAAVAAAAMDLTCAFWVVECWLMRRETFAYSWSLCDIYFPLLFGHMRLKLGVLFIANLKTLRPLLSFCRPFVSCSISILYLFTGR